MSNETEPLDPATTAVADHSLPTGERIAEPIARFRHIASDLQVQMIERYDSRVWALQLQTNQRSCERIYMLWGTEDDAKIRAVAEEQIPDTYQDTPRTEIRLSHLGGGVWEVRAIYQKSNRPAPVFSFDTTGATFRRTHSIATVGSYPVDAPDFKNGINVTSQGIEGVDITVPQFVFRETHYFENFTAADRQVVFDLTGKVNDDEFRGFAAGEVLFLGASGARNSEGIWEITYNFSVSPNATNLTVAGIPGIDKEGWHLLWTYDEQVEDANRLITRTAAVKVEQVYEYGSFDALGIDDPLE